MKRTLLVTIAALAASAAFAGDIGTPYYKAAMPQSAYSWTGWYAGVNGGYGISNENTGISGSNAIGSALVGTGAVPSSLKTEARGSLVGIQGGYNYQFAPQWVAGLETDIQYANIKGSDSRVLNGAPIGLPASLTTSASNQLDWFGTARARLGYLPTQNVMLYGTAGLAYGQIEGSNSIVLASTIPGLNGSAVGSFNDTKIGYAAGGGVEWAIAQNILLRAEYLYLNFDSHGTTPAATVLKTPVGFSTGQKDDFHLARVGASYRF